MSQIHTFDWAAEEPLLRGGFIVTPGGSEMGHVRHSQSAVVDLATFLDEGGDLAGFPLLEPLAEAVLVERPRQSEAERRLVAGWCRERVAAWLEQRPADHGMTFLPRTPLYMAALLWQADCLEDPRLASRFEERLPLSVRARCGRAVAREYEAEPVRVPA